MQMGLIFGMEGIRYKKEEQRRGRDSKGIGNREEGEAQGIKKDRVNVAGIMSQG